MKKTMPLFCLGAMAYPLLEVAWRGRSHWTMSLAGGICLPLLEKTRKLRRPLPLRCLLGAGCITLVELGFGCFCNLLLGWSVWDYSRQPLNLWGQICLPYCMLWCLLCLPTFGLLRMIEGRRRR